MERPGKTRKKGAAAKNGKDVGSDELWELSSAVGDRLGSGVTWQCAAGCRSVKEVRRAAAHLVSFVHRRVVHHTSSRHH